MKLKLISAGLCVAVALAACNSNTSKESQSADTAQDAQLNPLPDEHNSQNSLDWAGSYKGVLPCADCPGIETEITLSNDGTFSYTASYQDRDLTVEETGEFTWIQNGSAVQFAGEHAGMIYKVEENRLVQLDMQGEKITGVLADHYVLQKVQ